MASFFNLTLDTVAPGGVSLVLAGGAAYTASRDITATIGTSDGVTTGYQMKVWGAVDNAFNANIQTTEGASTWVAYNTSQAIRLSTTDGSKTVNVRIRDDVYNESGIVSASITLDSTVPVITITGPDVPKISKVAGKNVASFSFTTDSALTAYKVKVVPSTSSLESAGTTIGVANGSTNMTGGAVGAGGNVTCTINGTDLELASSGDGAKIIKVFGQEASGSWSV
jgi:hypothetical protein